MTEGDPTPEMVPDWGGSCALAALSRWSADGAPSVLVTVAVVHGSTPREEGAWMAVSAFAVAGTVGGGELEWQAVARARRMLLGHEHLAGDVIREEIVLGPATGQCCGGRLTLSYAAVTPELLHRLSGMERDADRHAPEVLIYGAGHVGRALAAALEPLPFRVSLIDQRAEELALCTSTRTVLIEEQHPTRVAAAALAGAAHVIMTHSHALDSLLAVTLLERGDFRYLGLIGSATKRARFLRGFREVGIQEELIARITCPIGGSALRDKRPAVIAALTAAEIAVAMLGENDVLA